MTQKIEIFMVFFCCLSCWITAVFLNSAVWSAAGAHLLPFTGYFLFFEPFSVNPRGGFVGKFQGVSSL